MLHDNVYNISEKLFTQLREHAVKYYPGSKIEKPIQLRGLPRLMRVIQCFFEFLFIYTVKTASIRIIRDSNNQEHRVAQLYRTFARDRYIKAFYRCMRAMHNIDPDAARNANGKRLFLGVRPKTLD
jgi:hypothetical protein